MSKPEKSLHQTLEDLSKGLLTVDEVSEQIAKAFSICAMTSAEKYAKISELICHAVQTDGAWHKQYDLEEIAKILKITLPEHDAGYPS